MCCNSDAGLVENVEMDNVVATAGDSVFGRIPAIATAPQAAPLAPSAPSTRCSASSRLSLRRALRGGSLYARRLADYLHGRSVERHLRLCGVGNAASIQTWTAKVELYALYDLALQCPPRGSVLEIGSYLGASTCYLCAGLS